MKPKVCVSITGKNFDEVKGMINIADNYNADFIEIRMDYLKENFDFSNVRRLTETPLIATNRSLVEGGRKEQPENERIDTLLSSVKAGFDFIDIELSTQNIKKLVEKIKDENSKPIVSFHNYTSTPTIQDFFGIFHRELEVGAEICKIVTMARSLQDNLTCLEFLSKASKEKKVISFCMGELGVSSRLLSPVFGGYSTYASTMPGRESAPGQLPIDSMRKIYELMGF